MAIARELDHRTFTTYIQTFQTLDPRATTASQPTATFRLRHHPRRYIA